MLVIVSMQSICSWRTVSRFKDTSDADWESFTRDYHRRFHRPPPLDLKRWLAFAKQNQCDTNRYYDSIDQHMRIFRTPKLVLDDVIRQATSETSSSSSSSSYTKGFMLWDLQHNKLTLSHVKDIDSAPPHYGGRPWWLAKLERYYKEWALRWLLQPLVQHQPPISTQFVWNIMDEPATHPQVPIFSACHEWSYPSSSSDDNRTEDFRNTDDGNTTNASLRTHTGTVVPRDLLVPYHFSIGHVGLGLWPWVGSWSHRGKPWRDRINAITWRGSTTGEWGTGPRFHLVETYGGGGGSTQPQLLSGTNVVADFAFVKVVQSEGRTLDNKYRVGNRMSYADMRKYKYVLDVDGNCKSFVHYNHLCVYIYDDDAVIVKRFNWYLTQ
jgi:hypothetical protein